MIEKMTAINPQILEWSRITSGTSLQEAYEKFGEDKIKAWECGQDFPTYSQLKQLCEYYRKPVAICFFPEPPKLKSIPSSCRTLPSHLNRIFSRKLMKVLDEARIMQLNLFELHEGVNPAKMKLTDVDFDCNNIEIAAKQLRQFINIDISEQKRFKTMETAFEC